MAYTNQIRDIIKPDNTLGEKLLDLAHQCMNED